MLHSKRWLSAVLAAAMTFSDFGGMTALATENTTAAEASVSDNNVGISDEFTSEDETKKNDDNDSLDSSGDTEDIETEFTSDTEVAFPALHIGQIKKGEALPALDDTEFKYDLPVSFALSDQIVLFVNYSLNAIPEEENGALVWSILRGEKGMTPGSTNLMQEDDDWTDFDAVFSSPYFTLTENKDEKSDYYQTVELALKDTADDDEEAYNYYIRAAYYSDTDNIEDNAFYAAATIPFLPEDTTDIENAADAGVFTEEASEYLMPDELSVSENTTSDKETLSDETRREEDSESADEENPGTDSTLAEILTISENHLMEDVSALSEDDTTPEIEDPVTTSLTLSQTNITLQLQDTMKIEATAVVDSVDAPVTVLWESDDDTVATVDQNGLITAVAEGYTKITASCYGVTASVMVDVVLDKENPDNDKRLDLSGDIRVAGFQQESDDLVYNGQKITQNLRVYHKETLLKEKTDYTLTYKNNINAAEWNTVKAPSVTITLKGQYSGSVTLYYTIKPLDINKIDIYSTTGSKSPGYEQAVNYSKKLSIPNPVLTFGKKKLAVNKDFICDYTTPGEKLEALPADYKNGDAYSYDDPQKVYSYTVKGIGNFTGSFPMKLVILKDKTKNFSSASVKLDKGKYPYAGTPLTQTDVQITELKIGKEILPDTHYDYEVCAYGLEGAYVKVYPSETGTAAGYHGCKQVNLKLEGDRQIKDALLGENWQETILFSQKTVDKNGGMFQQGNSLLVFKTEEGKEEPLTEVTDYTIKYSNAKKAGKVTVTFTGKGRYKGSLRKTYTITPNCDPKDLKITWGENVTKDQETGALTVSYQKGGASPALSIRDQEYTILNSKTDYSVRLSGKKIPDTTLTCTITGKGNYKGYTKTVEFTVTKADISKATLSVLDKPYDAKPDKWKSAVTVTDVNGKKLAVKTDYDKDIAYFYEDMDSEPIPKIGTSVKVTVQGTGYYYGTLTLETAYRIYDKANDISKLQIVIDSQEYTGKEITLPTSAIHVYANAADKKAGKPIKDATSCYEIIDYKNNIKAGTAKVTLHGIEAYGGTKTYSFKILKKAYLKNSVKGITLDNNALTLSMIELQDENSQKGVLTATITSQSEQKIANSTIIWTSSNNNIATVEDMNKNTTGNDSTTNAATATSTVRIKAYKEGSVTITAISQDGNKKATCKVTITNKPVFTEDGQTIKEDEGATYQLHLQYAQTDDTAGTTAPVTWVSSNPDAVSVDDTGLLTMNKAGVAIITVTVKKYNFTGQCYAVAVGDETRPSGDKVLEYEQADGTTDDTQAINNLLYTWEMQQKEGKTPYDYMYISAGVYHINAANNGIILRDNQTLIMSPSALLIAIPNKEENSRVIYAFGRDNVTISGGQIIGERKEHKGSSGEWGHGIDMSGCTNVHIRDVEVSQCWGDGIYLGLYNGWDEKGNDKEYYGSNITIENCNLHHNRRNNLSITDVSNVTVNKCQFNYASGHDPQYGIDIEPNIKGYTCEHITITDSTFQGNAKGTIQILGQKNAHVKDVTISGCKGDKKPLVAWGYGGGGTVSDVTDDNSNNWNWKP